MSDRFLWDRSGPADAEIERLERALAPLRHRGGSLAVPEERPAGAKPGRSHRSFFARPSVRWALAAAAAAIAVAGIAWLAAPRGWEVQRIAGIPRVGGVALADKRRVAPGDSLVTDAASSARVAVGRIGVVEVGPNSRLRVLGTRAAEHRLALDRGRLDAFILARPRQFVVETPSATAVDLGCAYALEVDALGDATLTVLAGWVSFEVSGRETFVPAGARCVSRGRLGPGTPYFTDASPALKNALAMVDLAAASAARDTALEAALAAARREDAFTLWHLLALGGHDRERVADRLDDLVPMPPGVTRDGVLAGDRAMLDRWWDALGFGGTSDWRRWKGSWPGERGR